jgi:hypothetical protein
LFSGKRDGQPPLTEEAETSSSGRLTPLSFQKFRYPLSRLSMEIKDALLALEEACLKKVPGELFWFLRLMNDEKDEMLPGLRRRSKREARSETGVCSPSAKLRRVGESVE